MTKTTTKAKTPSRDLYAEVTDSVLEALKSVSGSYEMPWTAVENGAAFPRNIDGRAYRGVNTVLLWASALRNGYTSGTWGTYKAWAAKNAQVRKGEKATLVILWKPMERKATAAEIADGKADKFGKVRSLLMRHYNVFAAEQVDGWTPKTVEPLTEFERDADAEAFFAGVGADVRFGGDGAYYAPGTDSITMPDREHFLSADRFYATMAHEHGHWTGTKARCARDLTGRFGTAAYAAEELVAEMTSAFVCGALGFHPQVRDDHAKYIKSWIRLLEDDKRAIVTAASHAQRATDFLFAAAAGSAESDVDDDAGAEIESAVA